MDPSRFEWVILRRLVLFDLLGILPKDVERGSSTPAFSRVDYEGAKWSDRCECAGAGQLPGRLAQGARDCPRTQQVYDFLPGGAQAVWVDGRSLPIPISTAATFRTPNLSDFGQSSITTGSNQLGGGAFVAQQPLARNFLEHPRSTATIFYEKGPLSMRAAYNWRLGVPDHRRVTTSSRFLADLAGSDRTARCVDLLFLVTESLEDRHPGCEPARRDYRDKPGGGFFDGTRITRSAFRNDRRFTFLARFDF